MATVGAMRAILSVNSTAFRAGLGGARTSLLTFTGASNTTTAAVLRLGMALTSVIGPFMGLYGAIRSVRVAEAFQQEMNSSLAIVDNASTAIRERMEKTAFEVAYATKFSMAEAAEAYYFLVSAGLDLEQSMKALPQVAAFAQAGMFDLARATELAAGAQAAMGMKLKDPAANLVQLTRVTDVLVKANKLAQASTEQFATALANDAANAGRMAGQSIEQVVAVLAAFAEKGLKGEQAGTSYARAINYLSIQAVDNADAFRAAGVAMFDASDKTRTLVDVIADLERRFAGMTDRERVAELQTLGFTKKTIALMNTLLGTSESIRGFTTELNEAGGTAQEVSEKQLTPLRKAWEQLKAVMTQWSINTLSPAMAEFGEGLSLLLDSTRELNEEMATPGMDADRFNAVNMELEGTAYWIGYMADLWDSMKVVLRSIQGTITMIGAGIAEVANLLTFMQFESLDNATQSLSDSANAAFTKASEQYEAISEKATKSDLMVLEKAKKNLAEYKKLKGVDEDSPVGATAAAVTPAYDPKRDLAKADRALDVSYSAAEKLLSQKAYASADAAFAAADAAHTAAYKAAADRATVKPTETQQQNAVAKAMGDTLDDGMGPLEAQMNKAKTIFNRTRTPLEKFNAQMEDLNTLLEVGAFAGMGGQETYDRAAKAAQEAYDKASGSDKGRAEPPALARLGSQDMYEMIRQNRMGDTGKEQPLVKEMQYVGAGVANVVDGIGDMTDELRDLNRKFDGGEELDW